MAENSNVKSMLGNQQKYRIVVKNSGQLHRSGETRTCAQALQKNKQSVMLKEKARNINKQRGLLFMNSVIVSCEMRYAKWPY